MNYLYTSSWFSLRYVAMVSLVFVTLLLLPGKSWPFDCLNLNSSIEKRSSGINNCLAEPQFTDGIVNLKDKKVLLRDGKIWYPKGMTFFGRVLPKGHRSDKSTMYAQRNFGQKYMDALKWMGGDTVRLQIGMPFLDPESGYFESSYINEIADAVNLARRNGMTVILSMQWQKRINVPDVKKKMPSDSTLRAWEYTAPIFKSDKGVLYELFNEPTTGKDPSLKQWDIWKESHQKIVDMIRSRGIKNVLIIDGPAEGKVLNEDYLINDPLDQTVYGIHPRLWGYLNTQEEWDKRFGDFADSHAVIATEWDHGSTICKYANEKVADDFLSYLERKNIGLIGWGMEMKNSKIPKILKGGKYKLSSFNGLKCGDNGAGPGEDIRDLFKERAD